MRKFLFGIFIGISILAKAQWVSIPDTNFGKCLQGNYPLCISGNAQSGFQLDTSCPFSQVLDCSNRQIKNVSGIEYIEALEINLFNNLIDSIPALRTGITKLTFDVNHLQKLPELPSTLYDLSFTNNQIHSCNMFPATLHLLRCENNPIDSLCYLPADLYSLSCGGSLSYLPTLPSNLVFLEIYHASILNFPSLPTSLGTFTCQNMGLRNLPPLPPYLASLDCSHNPLYELPPLPDTLAILDCTFDSLLTLPRLPVNLYWLEADNNNLQSIGSLPTRHLNHISLTNNPLLSCFPNRLKDTLDLLYFSQTAIQCLPNHFYCFNYSVNLQAFPLCDNLSGCNYFENISGNIHQYTSLNCTADSLHPGSNLSNIKITLSPAGNVLQQTYSYFEGEYSIKTDSNRTYQLKIDTSGLPFDVSCPGSTIRNVALTSADSVGYNQDFALECRGADVGVISIATANRFRNARKTTLYLQAGDVLRYLYDADCNTNSAGIVTTTFNGDVTFLSPAPGALTPTSVSGHTLSYAISDFSLLPADAFDLIFQTDTYAVIGSLVCVAVNVTPASDINPSNNSLTHCFTVTNSYDPNEKDVYPKSVSPDGEWLTYTVHFQNTGNDTAYDIVVRDTLSSFLDASSFQFLASSHPRHTINIKGNELVMSFPNINLVDSGTSDDLSQGWFQYRIKSKPGLPLQTAIKNTAYIYFDLNAAVKTNTAVSTVEVVSGMGQVNSSTINIYPNPNNGTFTMEATQLTGGEWKLIDALGRIAAKGLFQQEREIISAPHLSSGIYTIAITSKGAHLQERLIIR